MWPIFVAGLSSFISSLLDSSTADTTRHILAADLLGILNAVNNTPSIALPPLSVPLLDPQGVQAYKHGAEWRFMTSHVSPMVPLLVVHVQCHGLITRLRRRCWTGPLVQRHQRAQVRRQRIQQRSRVS